MLTIEQPRRIRICIFVGWEKLGLVSRYNLKRSLVGSPCFGDLPCFYELGNGSLSTALWYFQCFFLGEPCILWLVSGHRCPSLSPVWEIKGFLEELLKEEQDSLGLCTSQMMVSGTRGFKSVSGTKGKGSHPFAENGVDSVLSLGSTCNASLP